MSKHVSIYLNNHIYFRYAFALLLFISILINLFLDSNSGSFLLFILCIPFLGIGFYSKSIWLLNAITTLIVVFSFILLPAAMHTALLFILYLGTYHLVLFISIGLMTNYQKTRKDHLELMTALVNAIDSRDTYTLHHSENVAHYALEIAKKLNLPKAVCNATYTGALLHDIGKIGIPEHILRKAGALTDEEYEVIKSHVTIGYDTIKHVTSFLENGILDIVLYHHERYDGKGYPEGLKGEQIPLVARIVALADSFDAMISKRVYRNELEFSYVVNEIRKNKGLQFDPDITEAFLAILEEGKTVYNR